MPLPFKDCVDDPSIWRFCQLFLATKIFSHSCWGIKFIVSVNEVIEGNLEARFSSRES